MFPSLLPKMKIRTRLLAVNLLICAVFAVAVMLVLRTYSSVMDNLDTVVDHGVEMVTANAETGRDFALLFADTAELAENYIGRDDLLKSRGQHLQNRALVLGTRPLDVHLKAALNDFSGLLKKLLALCAEINEAKHRLNITDDAILDAFASLEKTLPPPAATTSLRNAVLKIRTYRAELGDRDFSSSNELHPLFEGLRGVESAVSEIPTPSVEAETAARRLLSRLADGRTALNRYFTLRKQLVPLKSDIHFSMDYTMTLLGAMDSDSRRAAVDVREDTGRVLGDARDFIIFLLIGVMLVSAVLTALFFRYAISRPMDGLCNAARSISRSPGTRVNLGRTDEWNEVERAMNTMADDLARSYEELRSKNEALQGTRSTLEFKVRELHDQIEARALAELKARTLNAELEQRVANRTAEMETAFKELESLSYSIAHDLRQPLRSIDGFSHALLDDYSDKLDEEGRDHLKRVRAATQQLGRLFDDFQHLTSVTRAKMRRSRFDLSALAEEVGRELQKKYPNRNVELIVQKGLNVLGDRHLLRLALTHLLDNAWKFTKRRERALIEVGSALEDDEEVFFVSDNGEGFDMRYAHKLFGPMNRLHAPDEFGGGGLGLAVIQRVIHRHSGRIWAVGEKGDGATFHFTLRNGAE